jgi:hypothetical protein
MFVLVTDIGRKLPQIFATVVGVGMEEKLCLCHEGWLAQILNESSLLEFTSHWGRVDRLNYSVNVIEEIPLGTADCEGREALVIGDETEDRNSTAAESITNFACEFQGSREPVVLRKGEHSS